MEQFVFFDIDNVLLKNMGAKRV